MRLAIVIVHAAFREERQPMLLRLVNELRPQCDAAGVPLMVYRNTDESSHLPGYVGAIEMALADGLEASHVCMLPDDAVLVPHFVDVLRELVTAHPHHMLDLVSNHAKAKAAHAAGATMYATTGGTINFGGTMPREDWRAYLHWREGAIKPGAFVAFDDGLNLWSVLTGRTVLKPLPSLCQHADPEASLDGNEWQAKDPAARVLRESQVWEPDADLRGRDWRKAEPADLGRTFEAQHWDIVRKLVPSAWSVEAMYQADRGGVPVSPTPKVMIAVPLFGEPAHIIGATEPSREAAIDDMLAHGIEVDVLRTPGDSLVQRMRQRVCHAFMRSDCTHLLWWDADLELLTPDAPRHMVLSGRMLSGGAYPLKDGTGRVVCNLWPSTHEAGEVRVEGGFLDVQDIGTGFMMVRREVHARLMQKHPELLHLSLASNERGQPLWALYDTAIDGDVYLSEDYQFCRLWQQAGGSVHAYVPARFKHYGTYAFTGSLEEQFGMVQR